MKKIKYAGAALVAQFLPLVALAQTPEVTLTKDRIAQLISDFSIYFAGIIFSLGILVMLYAAFLYMTAAGDDEKVGKAKKSFIYGLVGIGIAILAFGVFELVASFLEG
jgi:fumarate reductase subunit D